MFLAKEVLPYLTGNVHAQASPSVAYSVEGTVAEARRIIKTFEELDVPRSRVCIKIPVTAEGALACKLLQAEGIQTLGTCVFSLEQALAVGAAGCLYVAPYFNGKILVQLFVMPPSLNRPQSCKSISSKGLGWPIKSGSRGKNIP